MSGQYHSGYGPEKAEAIRRYSMKRFSSPTLGLAIALILSACGARVTPPPALSVADMQSTSAAVAFTMIAATQAAIPTATPIPPTETATITTLPTNTFIPLPSEGVTLTPISNSGGGEGCSLDPMPDVLHGKTIKLRVNNSTTVIMRLSVYLNDPTQCGYRAYNLDPGSALVLTDLVEGCYTLYAWNVDPDKYFIVTNGTNCLNSTDTNNWVFDISTRDIRLR